MPRATESTRGGDGRVLRSDALANQERVLAAAVTAVLRDGRQVPMATIAAEAGVGIGTLYRRYPNREALLAALTHRAFEVVLKFAQDADGGEGPALSSLSAFFDLVISHRDQLVLPLLGGPLPVDVDTRAVRSKLRRVLRRILERGGRDGSVRLDANSRDVIVFGALLSQPLSNLPDWEQTAQRLKIIFIDGLAPNNAATPLERQPGMTTRS